MSVKVIVSYDGTANEDDAIALGRLLSRAGAEASRFRHVASIAAAGVVFPAQRANMRARMSGEAARS